jgi:apolipoprotein N-acyltransferase
MNEAGAGAVFVLFALAKGLHSAVFSLLRPVHPLLFALLWTGLERTHGPLGFPWLTLGDAGIDSRLAYLGPLTGVYGLSFVFALIAAYVPSHWKYMAPLGLIFLFPPAETGPARHQALSVQPNFDEEAPPADPAAELLKLSVPPEPVRMVLWPEMPVGLYYGSDPILTARVNELLGTIQIPMVMGTVSFAGEKLPRNSAAFLNPNGRYLERYDKINLVPFGEYVPWPFDSIVSKVSTEAGTFTAGNRVTSTQISGHFVSVFICYESAFPHHVRRFANQGAEVLVNLTNDGYFARSAARQQHLALARMRAIENGRWVLRATNDGYTAAIDPHGRVRSAAPPYEARGVLLGFDYAASRTSYTLYGDWFAWGCLMSGLMSMAWTYCRRCAAS